MVEGTHPHDVAIHLVAMEPDTLRNRGPDPNQHIVGLPFIDDCQKSGAIAADGGPGPGTLDHDFGRLHRTGLWALVAMVTRQSGGAEEKGG